MAPNDKQEIYVEIDREVLYRERGKIKTIEVGKYNYKIIPLWTKAPQLTPKDRRARKKSNNAL